MPLENLTGSNVFITNLVPSNPAGTDPVSEGDNHIAGTKNAVLNSFPAINGAVTATPAQLNQLSPVGGAAFTGVPVAPTAAPGTSTTQIATTEFSTVAAQGAAQEVIDSSFGLAQTWQDVTASRAINTSYTNTTEKPIMVNVGSGTSGTSDNMTLSVGGVIVHRVVLGGANGTRRGTSVAVVPPGAVYIYSGIVAPQFWVELR